MWLPRSPALIDRDHRPAAITLLSHVFSVDVTECTAIAKISAFPLPTQVETPRQLKSDVALLQGTGDVVAQASKTARMRRTPRLADCSRTMRKRPSKPVRSTWGPPQISLLKVGPCGSPSGTWSNLPMA